METLLQFALEDNAFFCLNSPVLQYVCGVEKIDCFFFGNICEDFKFDTKQTLEMVACVGWIYSNSITYFRNLFQ